MKKNWWSSLQVKIIAWSFVPAVIILSAVAWFTFYSYQKGIGDLAIKQDRETVLTKWQQVNQVIGELFNPVLVPVIMEIDVQHEEPLEVRAQKILDQSQGLDIFDGGIYFLNQQGVVFKTRPAQPELIGQDWSDTPHFRSIQKDPNLAAFTDLFSIGSPEKKVVCAAVAMTGQKWETVGAAYYCFIVYPPAGNAYYQKLGSLDFGQNYLLLDRNNRVIYSPDPSAAGKDLSGEAYLQQLSQGESKSGRFRNGTREMLISYSPVSSVPIDQWGWILLKEQSWAEIMQPTLAYRQLLLVLLALGVIVPALVTAYGVRHITGPIQKLIRAAGQVTAGQFKQRIEVKTGDEIETLADQFNRMSEELDESYSSLERKVADRTRELAILNSIISVASHSINIQEILEDALNQTVEQMGFDAGAAFRFEKDTTQILPAARRGLEPAAAIALVQRFAAGRNPPVYPGEVTTIQIEDIPEAALEDQTAQPGFHLLVYVPLATKGREQGCFVLGRRGPGDPSPEELALLSSIGRQVGVAVENALLYEQAKQTAVVSERSRLARELHDAVTQTLFSASLIADVIPQIWKRSPEEGMQNLAELRQLTRGALAEMRTLLLEMRPESLERADIKSLFTQLADAFIGRVRIPLDLHIDGDCEPAPGVKIVFYRVAQEALNNIARHSGARQVALQLDCQPGHLHLRIQDDGLGFDAGSIPPGHMGVAIMRERAGSIGASLKIESQSGQGTAVALDWKPERKEGTDGTSADDPGFVGG